LVAQTCAFEISHSFLPLAFIENFEYPYPEASGEVTTADFQIMYQK